MFDNICRFLAETFSTDFAAWLLGEPITLTELAASSKFFDSPGLLPFAVLSQVDDLTQVLQRVALEIEQLADPQVQNNLTASASILAGLVLEALIRQVLRRDLMQEPVIYQSILQEEALMLIRRLLNRKVGTVPDYLQAQI